jgi:hypothetical protein
VTSFDIPPAIPNHVTSREIKVMVRSGGEQEPRQRLATGTVVGVVVRTHPDIIDRELLGDGGVDVLDGGRCL